MFINWCHYNEDNSDITRSMVVVDAAVVTTGSILKNDNTVVVTVI